MLFRLLIAVACYWIVFAAAHFATDATVTATDKTLLEVAGFASRAIWIPFGVCLFVLDWIAFQRRNLMKTYCRACGRVCEYLQKPKCENCGESI